MSTFSTSHLASICKSRHSWSVAPFEDETAWRQSTHVNCTSRQPVIAIGRWALDRWSADEHSAQARSEHYTIEVLLRRTFVECSRNGQKIFGDAVCFGGTQIAAPGQDIRCRYAFPTEAIHVFLPNLVIVSAYEEIMQARCPANFELPDPEFAADAVLGRLAVALANSPKVHGPCAPIYSESLTFAMLARLMETLSRAEHLTLTRSGLASWRLRRAIDYIEANLNKQIRLRDIAEHTGLSRMHFAAQFRVSMGLSPREFVLQKRLERAKQMLRDQRLPLVKVAFEAGFTSQSYFSALFRKLTGTTPGRWREQNRLGLSCDLNWDGAAVAAEAAPHRSHDRRIELVRAQQEADAEKTQERKSSSG